MGATRLQVFGTILIEGLLTAAAGCVLGLLAGHLALAAAVSSFDRLREIGIDPWSPHVGELAIIGGAGDWNDRRVDPGAAGVPDRSRGHALLGALGRRTTPSRGGRP